MYGQLGIDKVYKCMGPGGGFNQWNGACKEGNDGIDQEQIRISVSKKFHPFEPSPLATNILSFQKPSVINY